MRLEEQNKLVHTIVVKLKETLLENTQLMKDCEIQNWKLDDMVMSILTSFLVMGVDGLYDSGTANKPPIKLMELIVNSLAKSTYELDKKYGHQFTNENLKNHG